jgi:uncharacterized protein YndB with AHSA1/START domain
MSVKHANFTIERRYGCPPAQTFNAFSNPALKRQWFGAPDSWSDSVHELDFRVGGGEVSSGRDPSGMRHGFTSRFHEIAENERIVFAYDLSLDERLVSVSLTTIEFEPDGDGTRLSVTEQGAFLDERDDPSVRENGTGALLKALGRFLEPDQAS